VAEPRVRRELHRGRRIVVLRFKQKNFSQSGSLIGEYAKLLCALKPGEKARVLVDFEGSLYDPRLSLQWKARLGLFSERVEKSAVIGASRLTQAFIHGLSATAAFAGQPLGQDRAVVFSHRAAALDWLAN
jgi:hypothetical protein